MSGGEDAVAGGDAPPPWSRIAPIDPGRYRAFVRLVTDPGHRIVLSLGGGAVPGICGNAALLALVEELGVEDRVHQVWGTSAGAVAGGVWASGRSAAEVMDHTARLDRHGAVDYDFARLARSLVLRPFGAELPDALVRGRHFVETISAGLAVRSFEECRLPFRAIACPDDGSARRKVFREGELLPAILASMSIPGVLSPRHPDTGRQLGYYDGGVVEKTPLLSPIAEFRREESEEHLVLVATHFTNSAQEGRARGFVSRFLDSIYVLEEQLWQYQLREARERSDVTVLLLRPELPGQGLFDFTRLGENFETAREQFARQLSDAEIVSLLGGA